LWSGSATQRRGGPCRGSEFQQSERGRS
jgi:hypothetical protein